MNETDLCGVCGASWVCEHLDTRRIEGYVKDKYGPRVAKVAPEHAVGSPAAAAAYLRRLADAIADGRLPATAVMTVVSDEDVHRPFWLGYSDWAVLMQATNAVSEERSRRNGYGSTPEEIAERRRKNREIAEKRQQDHEAAHPVVCDCGDRFKTERGHAAHKRSWARRWNEADKHNTQLA